VSPPLTACPSEPLVHGLINAAMEDLANALALNDAIRARAPAVHNIVNAVPTNFAEHRLLPELRGRQIALRHADHDLPGFAQALGDVLPGQITYNDIPGFKSTPAQGEPGGVEVSWEFDSPQHQLLVRLLDTSQGKNLQLMELRVTGPELEQTVKDAAMVSVLGLMAYYERQKGPPPAVPPHVPPEAPCRSSPLDHRASGLLLAGLPQLNDCWPGNDRYGTAAAITDAVLMIGAGAAGYLALAARTRYSQDRRPSDLHLSQGLFVGAGVAFSLSLVNRGISIGVGPATAISPQSAQR
jgi:hypothetical protein